MKDKIHDPYRMILQIIDCVKLTKTIQDKNKLTKYGKLWFHRNNVYMRKSWRRPVPEKYQKIIREIYEEHKHEESLLVKQIDRLLKKDLQKEKE